MPSPTYKFLPTVDQWKKDSNVLLATRSKDTSLMRIDGILGELNTGGKHRVRSQMGLLQCDLFFALNTWVKELRQGKVDNDKGRYPAIMSLFAYVVESLEGYLKVTGEVAVSNALKGLFGARMVLHGYTADRRFNLTVFDQEDLRKYRVHFDNGIAMQIPWWSGEATLQLKPAESKYGYASVARKAAVGQAPQLQFPDYSGFICTMEDEIYMTKHVFDPENIEGGNMFHSSYTGQAIVMFAGTILIKNGIIFGIRLDSGHYKPTRNNLLALLRMLQRQNAPLQNTEVFQFDSSFLGSALRVLRNTDVDMQGTIADNKDRQLAGQQFREQEERRRKRPRIFG